MRKQEESAQNYGKKLSSTMFEQGHCKLKGIGVNIQTPGDLQTQVQIFSATI